MKFRVLFLWAVVMIYNGSAIVGPPPSGPSLIMTWDWPLNDFAEDFSFNFLAKTNLADATWTKVKSIPAYDCIGDSAFLTAKEVTKVVYEEDGSETYSVEWVYYIGGLSSSLPQLESDSGFFVMSYTKGDLDSEIF